MGNETGTFERERGKGKWKGKEDGRRQKTKEAAGKCKLKSESSLSLQLHSFSREPPIRVYCKVLPKITVEATREFSCESEH